MATVALEGSACDNAMVQRAGGPAGISICDGVQVRLDTSTASVKCAAAEEP
jgi:hypothetical protein